MKPVRFDARGKLLTCRADALRRNAMKAKAQRRWKRLGFSLDAGHPAEISASQPGGTRVAIRKMTPAPYPPNNTEELQAVITFLSLLDVKYAKPDPKWLDKIPNTDGQVEIVDEGQRVLGKLEIQIKKIPDGSTSFQCPIELPLFGRSVTKEYLFWFVDHYGQSVGIEATDRLNVAELNYGVFVFLPAWASLAVPRFLGEVLRLNKGNLEEIAHFVAAPPFEHVASVKPDTLRPAKGEVMHLIQARQKLRPITVRFTEASAKLLASAVNFLAASDVEWIDRPYKARSEHPVTIWSGYTLDALRHNIKRILNNSIEDYRLFVEGNQIALKDSLYLNQTNAIVYAADLTSWASAKDIRNPPFLKMYVVNNEDQKFPKATFVDVSEFPDRLVVDNHKLKMDGVEKQIIGGNERVASDLFQKLPILHRLYGMLTADLKRQFKTHRFK